MHSLQPANLLNGLHFFFTHKCTILKSVYDSFFILYIFRFAEITAFQTKKISPILCEYGVVISKQYFVKFRSLISLDIMELTLKNFLNGETFLLDYYLFMYG